MKKLSVSFLDMTEEKLHFYGFKGGQSTLLAKEAKSHKEKQNVHFPCTKVEGSDGKNHISIMEEETKRTS
jgi:hypothetical protein